MPSSPAPRTPRLSTEDGCTVVCHGPTGQGPFSRRIRLSIDGQTIDVQTRPFPTDAAAREAARTVQQALRHAFG
jgi:hypothetical protein